MKINLKLAAVALTAMAGLIGCGAGAHVGPVGAGASVGDGGVAVGTDVGYNDGRAWTGTEWVAVNAGHVHCENCGHYYHDGRWNTY